MFQRNYPHNPLLQPVKGVFVFKTDEEDYLPQAQALLKNMRCKVLSSVENRITVASSRGNLQTIKQCWLSNDLGDELSCALNRQVSQIIIGGKTS